MVNTPLALSTFRKALKKKTFLLVSGFLYDSCDIGVLRIPFRSVKRQLFHRQPFDFHGQFNLLKLYPDSGTTLSHESFGQICFLSQSCQISRNHQVKTYNNFTET